jgi:hypothetical protein
VNAVVLLAHDSAHRSLGILSSPWQKAFIYSEVTSRPPSSRVISATRRVETSWTGITAETAWLSSQAFGTTLEFWLNLQAAHDLAVQRPSRRVQRLRRAS